MIFNLNLVHSIGSSGAAILEKTIFNIPTFNTFSIIPSWSWDMVLYLIKILKPLSPKDAFCQTCWNWMDYSMDLECPKRQIHWLIGKIWKAIEKYHLTLVLIVELDRKKREYWCFSWMIEGIKVEKWQKIFTRHGVMKCMMMTLLLIWVQRSSKHQNVGLWKGNYNMIGQKTTTLNRSGSWYEMHE